MAEFLNDKQNAVVEVDDSNQSTSEHHEKDTLIPTLLGYLAAAFVVAVLVVLSGRFVYQKVNNSQHKNTPTSQESSGSESATTPNSEVSQAPNSNPDAKKSTSANTSSPKSSPQGSPRTATSQPSSPVNLPNSGPGEVAGLFAVTSLVAAGLHYLRRRASQI